MTSSVLGGIAANYSYDLRGNMVGLPHLQAMEWNESEELTAVQLNTNDRAYYRYSGGQRVRKVLEKSNKGEERLYLGGVERYREYSYGSSAYQVFTTSDGISLKRYCFTNKEKDEETGRYYFGVRYYAAWLGRWTVETPGGFIGKI